MFNYIFSKDRTQWSDGNFNSAFLDAHKIGNSFFIGDNRIEVNSENFPRIEFLDNSDNSDFECLSVQYLYSDKLFVEPVDCNTKMMIICMTYSFDDYASGSLCEKQSRVSFLLGYSTFIIPGIST